MRLLSISSLLFSASATLMYTEFIPATTNPSECASCSLPTSFNPADVKTCLEKVPTTCEYSLKVVKTDGTDDSVTPCPDTLGFIMKDIAADFPGATLLPGADIGFTATLPAGDTCTKYFWKSSTTSKCAYPADGSEQEVAVSDGALYISVKTPAALDLYWNVKGETGKTCATKFTKAELRHLTCNLSVKGLKTGGSNSGVAILSPPVAMATITMIIVQDNFIR